MEALNVKKAGAAAGRAVRYFVLAFGSLVTLYPLIFMCLVGFFTKEEYWATELSLFPIPTQPTIENYLALLDRSRTGDVLTVTYEGSGVSQVPMTDAAVTVSATAAQQEEGTQTVTVSYGGMSATFTITVEAQADPGTEGEENGTEDPDGGLPAGAIAGIVIACVVVVAGAVTAVVLIRKKKGGKQ